MSDTNWPHILTQNVVDSETGEKYTQTITALSVDTAIAEMAPTEVDVDYDDDVVVLALTQDNNEDSFMFVANKGELLLWAAMLLEKLAKDVGSERTLDILGGGVEEPIQFRTFKAKAKA